MKTIVLLCAVAAFARAEPHHYSPLEVSRLVYSHPLVRVYPGAPLNPDGTVADTPEVTAAKINHFAAKNEAIRKLNLKSDGTVSDTPEVVSAKIAHFTAVAKAGGAIPYEYTPQWFAEVSRDTPEVAAAKIAHFAAHARAQGINPYLYAPYLYGAPPLNPDGTVVYTPEVRAVNAVHLAAPAGYTPPSLLHGYYTPINADGTVADTPEVVARKFEHLAAHGVALARHR